MQPRLNYDKHDLKFISLGKVFKFIENKNIKDIYITVTEFIITACLLFI